MGIHWIINTTEKVVKITPQKTESDGSKIAKRRHLDYCEKTGYTQKDSVRKDSVRVNTKRKVTS
jgi:hypothetical protein